MLNVVQLSGKYGDGGENPASGTLTFTPSAVLTDGTDHVEVRQPPVIATLGQAGTFTVELYATDNANLLPAGWGWNVTECIAGTPPYTWTFFLPGTPFAFTATDASPAVFTASGSDYAIGDDVALWGPSLPGGFTAGTVYYVASASPAEFTLAASPGGPALASSSAGPGTVATATLDISDLAPVASVTTMASFLQGDYPGGTTQYLRADGTWDVPAALGNLDGGSAAGGQFPAFAIDGGDA